jgi:cold shock CspA family protein
LRTASFGDGAGTVTQFDEAAGLGEITAADGVVYPFHCTAIADGSRDIEAGRNVTFTIAAGHLGRLEATDIK